MKIGGWKSEYPSVNNLLRHLQRKGVMEESRLQDLLNEKSRERLGLKNAGKQRAVGMDEVKRFIEKA